jgi:hypothetical protein
MKFKGYNIKSLRELKKLPPNVREEFKREFKKGFKGVKNAI